MKPPLKIRQMVLCLGWHKLIASSCSSSVCSYHLSKCGDFRRAEPTQGSYCKTTLTTFDRTSTCRSEYFSFRQTRARFCGSRLQKSKDSPGDDLSSLQTNKYWRVGTSALNSLSRLIFSLRSPQSILPSQTLRAASGRYSLLCIRYQHANHIPGCGVGVSMQRSEPGFESYPDIMGCLAKVFPILLR